ncbi:MmgE/PrpD family protein [Pusillimonas sp. ANT_WB101]|uniref:MmgE/PrpD family protein n=1 Tax=Pusillimonas sp. ANT_WB101 TaxID=2597356 RepID=UPI0011EED9C2|nr:MmgE/PrpD family protein [Pusillimonas sp. ANT_WB101]KAA0892813.1 MmgE/PrpD family protein [Pusillimonas sp. ANT_WB101]
MPTLSSQLATICLRPVSNEAVERARLHLLDWLGCAAVGAAQPSATALLEGSSLFPIRDSKNKTTLQRDPWHALLFTASVGNIMEMDDIHREAIVHPGPVIIPTALFLGQELGRSLRDVLVAIVRGYEAIIRLGASVGPQHYQYWHNTATCGSVGAAAAAASLLGLPVLGWQHAFGHAATQSAGLWQVRLDPCLSKQWHVARAAQTGIQAALLAQAGAAGPERIFEGEKGFFAAFCPDGDPSRLCHNPQAPWRLFDTSFKPWPACRHTHAAIDAALKLRDQQQLDFPQKSSDITQVEIESYSDAVLFCDQPTPCTGPQARFSLQHAVAVSLLFGAPTLAHFEYAAINDPRVAALRKKVVVKTSEHWSSRYPAHYGASVSVTTGTGLRLTASVNDVLGDPERPLSPQLIRTKAETLLAASGWPERDCEVWLAACLEASEILPFGNLCAFILNATQQQLNTINR